MTRKLERWIEQLADLNPHKIVTRAGDNRTSLSIVGRFDCDFSDGVMTFPDYDELETNLTGAGYGDDLQYARVIAYDEKGRQIKSVSLKHDPKQDESASLVDGMLAMAAEMRRFVATINTTLEAREETLQHIIDQLMIAKHAEIESHAASIALDLELQKQEEMQGTDSKERALALAEHVVSQMMGAKLNPSSLKDLIMSSPEIVDELLKDKDVVELVGAKFLAQ